MIELTLPAMTCSHCVRTVTETLKSLDAGARLDFDLPQHKVRIESATSPAAITTALTEAGYPPVSF
jgi:copper chaperone